MLDFCDHRESRSCLSRGARRGLVRRSTVRETETGFADLAEMMECRFSGTTMRPPR